MNCVNAAALNLAVGRVVCGAAVEGDPGPRKTRKVIKYAELPSPSIYIVSQTRPTSEGFLLGAG